jgi:hypothetical protein
LAGAGGLYTPVDENLMNQLEEGYKQKWISRDRIDDNGFNPRWNLFGTHIGEFVMYINDTDAYVQTDGYKLLK